VIARLFLHILRQIRAGTQQAAATARIPGAATTQGAVAEERPRLTELAERVGLVQRVAEGLAAVARTQEEIDDKLEQVVDLGSQAVEGVRVPTVERRAAEPPLIPAPPSPPPIARRAPPRPMLGVGAVRVAETAAAPGILGARPPATPAGEAAAARLAPAFLPVLKALGLLAVGGFALVKSFQMIAHAAEKAGSRLLAIFDQFADVSPAAAGMRALVEVYRRRERAAVAAALAPQWQRELQSYRELLDSTRHIQILSQQMASIMRTFFNRVLAVLGSIVDHLASLVPGIKNPPPPEVHPLIAALLQVSRGRGPDVEAWRPVPPPPREPRAR
jgi:hypothetical protein